MKPLEGFAHEQAVAGADAYGGQPQHHSVVAPQNAGHFDRVSGARAYLRERLAVGEAAGEDSQCCCVEAVGGLQWKRAFRQQLRRQPPQKHDPHAAHEQNRQGEREHAERLKAKILGDAGNQQIG